MRGHNEVRDYMANWVRDRGAKGVVIEQHVPSWDRVTSRGAEQARLDVAFINLSGVRSYIDVTIVDAQSSDRGLLTRRANQAGAAARRAEDTKRAKYPGPALVPFAIEALGRAGDSAANLLRAMAPTDPKERSEVLGDAWQSLSVLVQMRNAELLLSAAGV